MIGSSAEPISCFDGVDVKSVHRLLKVIGQSEIAVLQLVGKTYIDHARNFEPVLRFAKEIGWVDDKDGYLELTEQGHRAQNTSSDERIARQSLLSAITSKSSPYRGPVSAYLVRYSLKDTELTYHPSVEDRVRERSVRDFLMDLRVVVHRRTDDSYVLAQGSEELFVWAKNAGQPTSKGPLNALQARQDSVGQAAELAVLSYERTRLGEAWWPQIEHISAELPFSCYDIKSVTVDEGNVATRFIEVKAVPGDTFRFYWSKAELETAELLAQRYFVYLLPVLGGNFLLDRMLTVRDPYKAIYLNQSDWRTEEDVVCCSKR